MELSNISAKLLIPAALMASFGIFAWENLGVSQIPISGIQIHPGESIQAILELGDGEVDSIYLLITRSIQAKIYCGEPGMWDLRGEASLSEYYFHWLKLSLECRKRYLKLELVNPDRGISEVLEIGVFHGSKIIPIQSISPHEHWRLIDEQHLVEHPPSYRSGTFFDEIYFVRGAMELSRLEFPYESTHPPLGKLLIAAGISALGFNPMGWRIPSLIFGCMIIGIGYFMARRSFGLGSGILAGCLIWLDGMHLTYSRAALTENMVTGFMLASYLAGFEFLRNPKLRWILICFGMFGLGLSVKWYAGFGFLGMIILLWFRSPLRWFLLGIFTSIGIYLASFTPYFMMGYDLPGILNLNLGMLAYHWGLEAEHPFGSPWWSWPLMLTPVWMYYNSWNGIRSSIAALGNPMLWWAGLGFMAWGIYRCLRDPRGIHLALMLILGFQWLSYSLIQRVVFIYHFYINTPLLAVIGSDLLKRSKSMAMIYLILAGIWFSIYYPVSSGYPVAESYLERLRILPSWHF